MRISGVLLRPSAQLLGLAALAVGLISVAAPADAATHPTTSVTVLRAVTSTGHAARGWKVINDNRSPITCTQQSSVGVSPHIDFCGSSADYTPACWKSATHGRVLCTNPSDALHKTLRSIRLSGRFGNDAADGRTYPIALHLRNGMAMDARDGGAGVNVGQHPSWVAWYYDSRGRHAVYGPQKVPGGVNTSSPAWFVKVYDLKHLRRAGYDAYVGTAYFVGTAA